MAADVIIFADAKDRLERERLAAYLKWHMREILALAPKCPYPVQESDNG